LSWAAIAWKKKAYRSKFKSEENYVEFTKLTTRLLNAHTPVLAMNIQDDIVTWLRDVGEDEAADWFYRYWTGPRGNYTNASAGYSGSNSAQGIESRWRYLKRDVLGGKSNMSFPLKTFIPSLLAYLKAHSARHHAQLIKTNEGCGTAFPSAPTITDDMWKHAQLIDTRTFLLSTVECNPDLQRGFNLVTEAIAAYGEATTPLPEKIRLWQSDGNSMDHLPKTSFTAIIVPTTSIIKQLEKKGYKLILDLKEALVPLVLQYQQLMYKNLDDFYDGDTACLGPSHMLNIMEAFHRLTPIRKFGGLQWRCVCTKGFRCMACGHSLLFSCLWDDKLRVPPNLSEVVLPNRKSKTVPNVFNADKVMEEPDDIPAQWNPKICGKRSAADPSAKGMRRDKRASEELEDVACDSDFMEEPELQTSRRKKVRSDRARRLDLDIVEKPVPSRA
jgi:hypothetical protein